MSIDENNGTLHEGLGLDQLVIGSIEGDAQYTDFASADLGSPGEVTGVEAEGAVFDGTSLAADVVDALFAKFSHGAGSAKFELALLAEFVAATSGLVTFVLSFACDTYGCSIFNFLEQYYSKTAEEC